MALFLISLLTLSMVSASLADAGLAWKEIKVNGHEVGDGSVLAVEEGQTISIEVVLEATLSNADDIEVDAKISGYEYSDYEKYN